ncbi:MAG: ABC transporter ATP-binding protein [candidate division Zixibacteria bacterium]|nr:ABC transporter ATP-binding protein [candidate division Zixibacteria bacterium]
MSGSPAMAIEDVTFSYNDRIVLEKVNLTVAEREFVWIVGPNGGGKTTLIKIMLGLLRPRSGRVTVFGASAVASRRRIGYMPQQSLLDLRFPATVMDIALMGRLNSGFRPGFHSAADREAARSALDLVDLTAMSDRPVGELSGGQQRRLLIARALACDPELLLLDEPTANLDRRVERELHDLLLRLNKRLTIILVSHDPTFVWDFVERVVCVHRTVAVHPTANMAREAISELYGTPMRMVRHDRHEEDESAQSQDPVEP